MTIQKATQSHIKDISLLLKKAHTDWDKKTLQDCFSENYEHYIFTQNHAVLAYACTKQSADAIELLQICVDPDFHRQQIATQLLQSILQESTLPIFLEVRASNQKAIALYEKLQFKRINVRKQYYRDGEDAIVMQSPFPSPSAAQ